MTRRRFFGLALVWALALAVPAFGQVGKGLSGAHWNLNLIGVPKDKTLQKLAEFKSGDKPASIMHQISKGYTEEQLDLIATYFAAQK